MTSLESSETLIRDTGILVHGRDLHAPDVLTRRMLWGTGGATQRMGTIPTAVLAMLDFQPERVNVLTIGSGASKEESPTGNTMIEAEVIKEIMVEDFEELDEFKIIRDHPKWQDESSHQILREIIDKAVTDKEAQNTVEEITNAAVLFGQLGINRVIQVTGESHGPRCVQERSRLQMTQVIPEDQRWMLFTDRERYLMGYLSEPVILEPPHRNDDPRISWPEELWPTGLMRDFFELPADAQLMFAVCCRDFIEKTKETGGLEWFAEERRIAAKRREDAQSTS